MRGTDGANPSGSGAAAASPAPLSVACGDIPSLPFTQASIHKGRHVGQPAFSELFALLPLAGDSPPASKRTKIPRKSKAVRCEAVLPEQKCSQTRKRPQRILCVFSRALTQYEGISARQNRMFSCLSMANSARKRASVSECAAASRSLFKREPNEVGLV